jgi:hypothetical protein
MVANSSARSGTRSGMSTAYLMTSQRPYGRALGCAARMLRVLVLIRCGLRRGGSKRKGHASEDQSASHLLLLWSSRTRTEVPQDGCFTLASG